MLDTMKSETFLPFLGTAFHVAVAEGSDVVLRLVEVFPLGRKPARLVRPGQRDVAFSLRFAGPAEPFLPQRTWPVSHPDLGTHEIFLVPVGRSEDGFEYEAVFN
jgi:hypothetical protein